MLNQLVESKNNAEENKRKSGFLLTTLVCLVALLLGGWTYSLFAKNYAMGGGDLELSSLVAPVVAVDEPPPPEMRKQPEKAQKSASNKIILPELYEDISINTTPPKNTLGEKEVVNARQFNLSEIEQGAFNQIPTNIGRTKSSDENSSCDSCGLVTPNKQSNDDNEKMPEIVKPTPKPIPSPTVLRTSNVMNGRATYLAKPPYPRIAINVGASGAVNVQVLIDEKGNVISASAVSGHPFLRSVAEKAARESKFTPTFLSKQPVKVTGIIVYKFTQ